MMPPPLELAGAVSGILGTLLLALKGHPLAGWGFVAYMVSNVAWISIAIDKGMHGLLVQNAVFMLVAIFGVYTWLIRGRADTDAGETQFPACDLRLELLAAHARITQLEEAAERRRRYHG